MSFRGWTPVPPAVQSGAQFMEQMRRAEFVRAKYHQLLVEAGAEWDGMDGYDVTSLPEGKAHEIWLEACKLADGPDGTALPSITGQRAGPTEG